MPVTAKLSRRFYEVFGDEIANELVDWFNAVDATYRADLDRLNELNFQRFDTNVERRFAEFEAKVEQRFAEFQTYVDGRFAEADTKLETRLADLRAEMKQGFAHLRADMAGQRADLTKWMFAFWAGTLFPLAGLMIALVALL
jgi:hypothetical protein